MSETLEIYLAADGELQDVRLNGQSQWPIWFKVEWKGNGHLSAKIAGQRLSTREGDEIRFMLDSTRRPGEEPPAGELGDRTLITGS